MLMKGALLFCLLMVCLSASAQSDSAQKFVVKKAAVEPGADTGSKYCVLLINKKEFHNGAMIPKSDLLQLCKLKLRDFKTGGSITPTSFEWRVFWDKWQTYHSNNPADCDLLAKAMQNIPAGQIIFIREIKCKQAIHYCKGQYVFWAQ
jgi:hypothetical protein